MLPARASLVPHRQHPAAGRWAAQEGAHTRAARLGAAAPTNHLVVAGIHGIVDWLQLAVIRLRVDHAAAPPPQPGKSQSLAGCGTRMRHQMRQIRHGPPHVVCERTTNRGIPLPGAITTSCAPAGSAEQWRGSRKAVPGSAPAAPSRWHSGGILCTQPAQSPRPCTRLGYLNASSWFWIGSSASTMQVSALPSTHRACLGSTSMPGPCQPPALPSQQKPPLP